MSVGSTKVRARAVIKALWPGYRRRWQVRCGVLLEELTRLFETAQFSMDHESAHVCLEDGTQLIGMVSDRAHLELALTLRDALPTAFDPRLFRLARDVVTRFVYPHLRPDLRPDGIPEHLYGFHGQHRDTITDLKDRGVHAALLEAFCPKPGEVFIDCGAFIGMGALAVARHLAPGRVLAIEADPQCFQLLKQNLAANATAPVECIHAALWNTNESRTLASGYAQGNSLLSQFVEDGRREQVNARTLDSLVAELALDRVDMISLTINGAEPEALEGAAEVLRSMRPRLRIAGWYSRGDTRIAELVKQPLTAAGYRVWIGPHGNCLAIPLERMQ